MLGERNYHLMVIDDDRYFSDGLAKIVHDIYPGIVIKKEMGDVETIDCLLIASDDVSPAITRILATQNSRIRRLVLMNETPRKLKGNYNFNQYRFVSQLSKSVTHREMALLMASIMPEIAREEQKTTLYLTTTAHTELVVKGLTPQERKTIRHMQCERSLTQIAHILNLSPKTVSHHKRAVMKKLGFKRNTELYSWMRGL